MQLSDPETTIPEALTPSYLTPGSYVIARGGLEGARRLHQLGEDAELRVALGAPDRAAEAAEKGARRRALLAAPAANRPLGIPALPVTTVPAQSEATAAPGEQVAALRRSGAAAAEAERSAARRKEGAADRIRVRYDLQDCARALLPDHRVARCCHTPTGGLVAVNYHAEHGTASYGGLQTCGSVWACPICAAKIGARRSEEVAAGASAWRARGGHLYMLTLTVRHDITRSLSSLHENINAAYRRMRQGRMWQLAIIRWGLIGSITAREHTHGKNGWHPHLHVLLFVTDDLKERLTDLEQWIAKRWAAVLSELGEDADLEHGTDVRPADDNAARYIGKLQAGWGIAGELAGAAGKAGRQGNKTPAQLLDLAASGSKAAGELYREYVAATAGTRWLVWTPNLRHLCGLEEEKTDDEVVAEETAEAAPLLVLSREQWRWVCGNGLRGWLLGWACRGDGELLARQLAGAGLVVTPTQLEHSYGGNKYAPYD